MNNPEVLYEDADIVAVNKPSGLIVHGDGRKEEPTLAAWLLDRYPDIKDVGEPLVLADGRHVMRAGLVHRLDKETSGVMVVARTARAFENLKKQFARREVRKTYRAFVNGFVKDDRGIIDKPLGRAKGSISRRTVKSPQGELRDAITAFRTISRSAKDAEFPASYVEAFPKTGRTHQIRVHLSSISHPVVCDKLYAPQKGCILGFNRTALHALSLAVTHPVTGQEVSFEAPLPEDFREAERRIALGA